MVYTPTYYLLYKEFSVRHNALKDNVACEYKQIGCVNKVLSYCFPIIYVSGLDFVTPYCGIHFIVVYTLDIAFSYLCRH